MESNTLNVFIGIGQILAVALIPLIVWWMGIYYQDRKAKKDAKLNLFLNLMANRKGSTITKEKVDSLNLIDVVFQDDKKVRKAWRDYLDSLNPNSQYYANNNAYLLDLLSEMAMTLGYKELRQTEIDRFYEPSQFANDRDAKEKITSETYRVLLRSKSCATDFTDEEYNQHLQELGLEE